MTISDATVTHRQDLQAFQSLLLIHTLFLPKQGDAEGQPYPAASVPLEMPEKMQYRLDGFLEAELERYADELAEHDEDAHEGSDGEDTIRGSSDDEDEPVKKTSKKTKKAKPSKGKTLGKVYPPRGKMFVLNRSFTATRSLKQSRLEKEYVFTSTIASFLSALRAGVVTVRHTAKPLVYYGRLGGTYDQCMKVIIELLREEGMYKGNGAVVADVIKEAIKEVSSEFCYSASDADW